MAEEEGEAPPEVWPKKGSFVFPNGARYGAHPRPRTARPPPGGLRACVPPGCAPPAAHPSPSPLRCPDGGLRPAAAAAPARVGARCSAHPGVQRVGGACRNANARSARTHAHTHTHSHTHARSIARSLARPPGARPTRRGV